MIHVAPSYSSSQLQFRSGFWSTFTGNREGAVADVLKALSSIDVLVEVTSALLARISSQQSLWQVCGMDGISAIRGYHTTRAAQVANVVTLRLLTARHG